MSGSNPAAVFAESITELSKAAFKAFSEVESQARQEVARTAAELREAKAERDKALKSLHASHLEAQSWKQELASCKAALSQAELTVSHQADTITVQVDTIAQLRRELAQWKDQSRNWQEHFLRVEQERCAQSSRIDELVVEKLQIQQYAPSTSTLFTPNGSSYPPPVSAIAAHPSSKRGPSIPSPTQPPPYRTAAPASPGGHEPPASANNSANVRASAKRPKAAAKARPRAPAAAAADEDHADEQMQTASAHKRSRKNMNAAAAAAPIYAQAQAQPQTHTPRAPQRDAPPRPKSTTVIRRVHAVINVKQESDSEEELGPASTEESSRAREADDVFAQAGPSTSRRERRRMVIDDEDEEEPNESEYDSERSRSGSEQPVKARLRNRSRINYEEEEDPEDSEDDELMLNADDKYEQTFSAPRKGGQRSMKRAAASASPRKKRKYIG